MNIKLACIIQGNPRINYAQIVAHMSRLFDVVVLSVWSDSILPDITQTNVNVIRNTYPACSGLTNRNLQRKSTESGIIYARMAGCNYVLKWRSDMLPTNLDIQKLLSYTNYQLSPNIKSRIVTCSYRCLGRTVDNFSSICDYYHFGHIDEISKLWIYKEFDYSLLYNLPADIKGDSVLSSKSLESLELLFCAETELYALYKETVQLEDSSNQLDFHQIIEKRFYLCSIYEFNIVWFRSSRLFRPLNCSSHIPWITPGQWKANKIPPSIPPLDSQYSKITKIYFLRIFNYYQIAIQIINYLLYHLKMRDTSMFKHYPTRVLRKINFCMSCATSINMFQVIRSLLGLPFYITDVFRILRVYSGPIEFLPITGDKFQNAGSWQHEYFWQDLIAASIVCSNSSTVHCDFGSRVDGFVSSISLHKHIYLADIRPLNTEIPNVTSFQCDISQDYDQWDSALLNTHFKSISCLHALEHIGLGRYGDPILKDGWAIGLENLSHILDDDGQLLVSIPCGKPRLIFNANYIIDPVIFLKLAQSMGLSLSGLYSIDSHGYKEINTFTNLESFAKLNYILLLFIFQKVK